MTNEPGFKRLHRMPRRVRREYINWTEMTARGRYLYDQSLARYRRRPDVYEPGKEMLTGEMGVISGFRIILSPFMPESS